VEFQIKKSYPIMGTEIKSNDCIAPGIHAVYVDRDRNYRLFCCQKYSKMQIARIVTELVNKYNFHYHGICIL
jgi:hypothetical protein